MFCLPTLRLTSLLRPALELCSRFWKGGWKPKVWRGRYYPRSSWWKLCRWLPSYDSNPTTKNSYLMSNGSSLSAFCSSSSHRRCHVQPANNPNNNNCITRGYPTGNCTKTLPSVQITQQEWKKEQLSCQLAMKLDYLFVSPEISAAAPAQIQRKNSYSHIVWIWLWRSAGRWKLLCECVCVCWSKRPLECLAVNSSFVSPIIHLSST